MRANGTRKVAAGIRWGTSAREKGSVVDPSLNDYSVAGTERGGLVPSPNWLGTSTDMFISPFLSLCQCGKRLSSTTGNLRHIRILTLSLCSSERQQLLSSPKNLELGTGPACVEIWGTSVNTRQVGCDHPQNDARTSSQPYTFQCVTKVHSTVNNVYDMPV